jgi:deazaflavin-dependent oxidoreductase (nitroreductase family)
MPSAAVGSVCDRPKRDRLGTLRLHTVGWRSGDDRTSMLYYLAEDHDLAVVASNAGAEHDPAWWRNLQSDPRATVDLPGERRAVHAREADAAEHARLWPRFVALLADYERYASVAGRPIPIVILAPAEATSDA